MSTAAVLEQAKVESWTDEEIVERVRAGETALFEIIMRRHNQRLYRATLGILRSGQEAEDVMQDAYVRAYQHLDQFAGRAKFATWLTRIAVNEALARAKRGARFEELDETSEATMDAFSATSHTPEQQASRAELQVLLEEAIATLPPRYRSVLMMRDVEEMSTVETAECLGIREENVKVRLHRARALIRKQLYQRAGATSSAAFQFHASRCDRVVRNVFARIAQLALG
jgi:RNA polymerase sigma-70 factor (ECF subfamily)